MKVKVIVIKTNNNRKTKQFYNPFNNQKLHEKKTTNLLHAVLAWFLNGRIVEIALLNNNKIAGNNRTIILRRQLYRQMYLETLFLILTQILVFRK